MPFNPADEARITPEDIQAARVEAADTYPGELGQLPDAESGGPQPIQTPEEARREQEGLAVAALAALFFAPFFWRPQDGMFVDSNGRIVSGVALERIMDAGIVREAKFGKTLANALQLPEAEARRRLIQIARDRAGMRNLVLQMTGRTSLPVELPRGLPGGPGDPLDFFEDYMLRRIRSIHLNNAALAAGGYSNLGPDERRALLRGISQVAPDGRDFGLRFQMQRFERMMQQVRDGTQKMDGTFVRRVQMYTDAGRQTFDVVNRVGQARDGFLECQNVTTAKESCGECPALSARGFVPLPQMPPIGTRECLTNCKCYLRFRNPETGEVRR